ncbi:hypothetical protein KSP9073_00268 [Kushneria phyllosphaerae]|uniref:Uncharacterized protein n=1 Tax=Kushneria phyllosphaerae TaxID=2100822 RepID=A0A2R8CH92_9GAMM|nr:hypothetical protein KSP9073_00268 [Kushneria phyllosphaerae]
MIERTMDIARFSNAVIDMTTLWPEQEPEKSGAP